MTEPRVASYADLGLPPLPPRPRVLARVVAGVLSVPALLLAALVTGGVALAAPVGVGTAALLARRHRRPLRRSASWIGAVAAAGLTLACLGVLVAKTAPSGTWTQLRHTIDSTRAATPPPAWVDRASPGSAAMRNWKPTGTFGRAFETWAAVSGGVIGGIALAAIAGSLGWLATLPLAFALGGRWLSAADAPLPDESNAVE